MVSQRTKSGKSPKNTPKLCRRDRKEPQAHRVSLGREGHKGSLDPEDRRESQAHKGSLDPEGRRVNLGREGCKVNLESLAPLSWWWTGLYPKTTTS